jgi:WD40 repeat protein
LKNSPGGTGIFHAAVPLKDGKGIVTSDGSSSSRWSVDNGRVNNVPFEGNSENLVGIRSVSISPNGLLVATASKNRTVMIWQAENGKLLCGPLEGHTHDIYALNFSADSKMVVSGSDDRNVWVWLAETGESICGPMESHAASVKGVCFRCTLTYFESLTESDGMYQSRREAGCQRYVLIA